VIVQSLSLCSLAAAIAATAFSILRVSNPIKALNRAMQELASGELNVAIPGESRGDELGAMAKTVAVFRENAVARVRLEAAARQETEKERRRQAMMDAEIGAAARSPKSSRPSTTRRGI
jgi:methyl-accepting chemotaxis protein